MGKKSSVVRLRWVGIWNTCPGLFPHPAMLMGANYTDAEKEAIARYIEQTPAMVGRQSNPFNSTASLIEGPDVQLSLLERSDGCWAFHDNLAYYVRKGVRLPDAFVQYVRIAGYRPPSVSVDYRLVTDDYGEYWIRWSILHSSIGWMYLCFLVKLVLLYPVRVLLWPFRRRARPV